MSEESERRVRESSGPATLEGIKATVSLNNEKGSVCKTCGASIRFGTFVGRLSINKFNFSIKIINRIGQKIVQQLLSDIV